MKEKVKQYIKKNNMLSPADKVICGVSGGADSVCLLTVLKELSAEYNLELKVVHINHMIREEAADSDESYVAELCKKYNIPFVCYREDIRKMARQQGLTVEEAGRKFRYKCFSEELENNNFTKIAVAHNKDDLCETVIFNMARGSSVNGIAGIKPVRGNIIRPLLDTRRSEIEKYLSEKNISFCTDATNYTLDYTRNRIRHVIIPELEKINSRAIDHICRTANDCSDLYDDIKVRANEVLINYEKNIARISVESLRHTGKIAGYEAILSAIEKTSGQRKDITEKHISSVYGLTQLSSGKSVNLPYQLCARRSYNEIIIERVELSQKYCIELGKSGKYEVDAATLNVSMEKAGEGVDISKKEYTKTFDYGKIKNSLCLRTPEAEDYIVINKAGGTKKLARLFTDCKIDRSKREKWPLVCCEHEVIWAIGLRMSEAYKVTEDTEIVMILKYDKGEKDNHGRQN